MGIYDEVRSRTGNSGIMVGPALSADEAHALGLSSVNPLVDELERSYERYVTENPDEAAARAWNAERVGVPLWVQERSDKYANEAKKRLALLEKGTPDWKKLADASPVTASFMTGDGVMASAHDDVQGLADIEDVTHSLSYLRLNYKDKLAYLRNERIVPRLSVPTLDVKDRPGMLASLPLLNPRAIGRGGWDGLSEEELVRLRDKPVSQTVAEAVRAIDSWASDTSFGKGITSGYEMSAIGTEAHNLFLANSLGRGSEAQWVELEKRVLALDREKPEGWLSGMLYETGKFIGQQAQGAWTSGLMSAAGAGLGAYAGSLGTAAFAGSVLNPVGGAVLAGAAAGWWLGTKAGVFTQASKTEMGLDLIERRMMRGADGEYISNFAAGLGSLAVGAVNGALELTEWTVAGRPFTGVARRVVSPAVMKSVSQNIASRLSALPSMGKYGQAARYWGSNVFAESMTEVFQELVPITVDEMQKHALLDGYNARRLGDVTAELTDTFMSSLYSFALISAVGPVAGLAAGRFNGELTRREFEAAQTKLFNMKMDNFKERIGASKVFKRFPSMSREHREAVLENADLSRAYIGAEKVETLFQQGLLPNYEDYGSAADWAQDYLGVTEDEYNESMQTGYEMELAAAKLFDAVESSDETKVNEIYDAIARDIRFSRGGMTLAEAEAADKSISEIRREDFFNIGARTDEAREEEASARRVYEASRMQMEASGIDAETAAADSFIRSAAYRRLAGMYNSALDEKTRGNKKLLAEDMERMFPLVIEKDGTGNVTGLTFQQTAWHGSPFRFDRFSTENIGTGEGAQAHGWGLYFAGDREVSEGYRKKLRSGRSRGQLYKVDIPENDVLLDEQKNFAEQPETVRSALKAVYESFPAEKLALVRDELKALVRRDASLEEEGDALRRERQKLLSRRSALNTVNAERPSENRGLFVEKGNTARFDRGVKYLHEMYYEEQIARLESDEAYLASEKDAVTDGLAEVTRKMEENERRIEEKRAEKKAAIDVASLDELLSRMDGRMLYNGIVIMTDSPRAASETLNAHGVKGVTYEGELDGRSYVVFDDNDVDVMQTYYQAGALFERAKEAIKRVIDVAFSDKTKHRLEIISGVQQWLSDTVLQSRGLDIAGYRHCIDTSSVRHIFKQHGDEKSERSRGQIPVTENDLLKIPEVIASPDFIVLGTKNRIGNEGIIYVKNMPNGSTFYVEEVRGKNKKQLVTDTMWIKAGTSDADSIRNTPTLYARSDTGTIDIIANPANNGGGNPYLQPSRGSITFPQYQGAPITIHLGKDADRSTFVHEFAHLYFWHLRNLASLDTVQNTAAWEGPEAEWNRDLKIVSRWWGENAENIARQAAQFVAEGERGGLSADGFREWLSSGMERRSAAGAAYDRAAQEYFARGFERYLMEGKTPANSRELLSVFRRFKKWLCDIYRTLTELDVELSDEVRSVFGRMVAADEAIEQLRAERQVDAVMAARREAAEAEARETDEANSAFAPVREPEPEYDIAYDPYEDAKENLLGLLFSEDMPERRREMAERAEEIRPQVLQAVLAEPGYRALAMMEQAPELRLNPGAVVDMFSETVLSAMPEGSIADDGMTDIEFAARSLNFKSAHEMIDAMAGRRTIKEEVDARVREIVAREFTDTFSSPAAMDAAAEAALYENDEHGERLAAEAEANFDDALELAAREEEAEAEFRAIFEADEAARVENEDPVSRTNVVRWMRAHGRPRYSYVAREMGQEDAQALLKRYGPSFFSKEGRGLNDIAQELDGMGIRVGGEAGLFNLLMSEAVPESPLDLAREEGRREVMDEYRTRYKKHVAGQERRAARNAERIRRIEAKAEEKTGKAKARYKAAAERLKSQMKENHDKAVALRKEIRARYQKRKTELEEKYKAMGERRRASFIEQKNKDWTRRALNRYLSGFRTHIEKSVSRKGLHDAAKTAARNQVAGMTVQQLYDVTGWVRVEKDSRAAADRALRNFDEKAFREAREKELHAHEMIRAMYRARRRAEYIRSRLVKYSNRKQKQTFGMIPEFLYQLDMLLTRFDFTKRTKKEVAALTPKDIVREAKSLSEFIKGQTDAGVPLMIPDWIAQSESQMKYEGLFVHQLENAFNAVQNIMQTGRDEKKTIARAKNLELSGIEAAVVERAQGYFGKDKVDGDTHIKVARKDPNVAADVLLDLNTIEAMCRGLDGFQDDGPMQDFFFRPVREAVSREYAELNRMFGEFRSLKLRVYGKDFKADMTPKDIGIHEYKRETDRETGKVYHVPTKEKSFFTQENIICAALNMGNADNLARLKDGWGWTDADIEKIKEQMSQKDWEYVQGVWDLLDTMWPKIKKVHELMTGMTIEKVEAKPVVTKYGTFRGGYYPIVTDLRYSETAAAQNEREEVFASAPLNFASKHTKSGHRKARAENVLGRPPLLSFSVLDNHVANVIHDYEMASVLRDAGKILRLDKVKSVITAVYGDRGYRNFRKWLNDIAANTKNNGVASGSGDRIVNGIKSKTAMFALGGNLGGAVSQLLGYFPLAHRIGFVNTALAILDGLNPGSRTYDFVREKSAFMREQMDDGNSEVRKLRQNWTTNDHGISRAADMFLSIYPFFQNMCNVPGWAQCYKIGLKRYRSEAKAVAYADSVIRQTQSASTIADLTSFERSGTIGQLTTMFYSWFRVMYQMQNEAVMRVKYEHGINRVKDLASYAFYILIAQSVAEALLRGNGPEPEDGEDPMWSWAKWTTARVLLSPLSTVPFAREFGSAIDNNFKFGVQLTPAQGGLDALARLLKIAMRQGGNALSGEDIEWGDVAEGAATVAGYRYGVPNRKMIQAAKAFWAYYDEEEAIPWAYLILGGGYKPKDE
ncbi:hypothetical protein [Cloacibacillus sp. An23]|uniref:PBECR3 domain-containing polyvalent protein n=1 Tax=Cloacibacillus sp. An23 TaxID=1965591 RepID=UPI000B3850DC|nr:hypothetical protein [Cloacibacillus sp. An23]OUO94740.1 hypothetical protein B5F39_02400 [Cloacibacillus sp. An23]